MTETPIFDALRQAQPLPKLDDATNRAGENLTRTLEELANLGLRGLSQAPEVSDQPADDQRPNATVTPIPRQADKDHKPADAKSHAAAAS